MSALVLALVLATTQSSPPSVERTQDPPPATLASYFGRSDYPASALRNREEGAVTFRITVGTKGRVTDCTILESSRSAALDSTTCRIAVERLRFRPARDGAGNPIAETLSPFTIRWELPD